MFRAVGKIKNSFNKLDNLTIMSHKHANNLVCDEDKMISKSLKLLKNKNYSHVYSTSVHNGSVYNGSVYNGSVIMVHMSQ